MSRTPLLPTPTSADADEPHIDLDRVLARVPVANVSTFENWGRTFVCTPRAIFEPRDATEIDAVLALARRERTTVRAVGVGHSPSDLACTSGYMMRMGRMDAILEIDPEKRYVRAQGGVTLQRLHAALAAHGLAMINVGSISEQTLAGMVTTATHGTGLRHQVLSTHVLSLTLLLASGARVRCDRESNKELFWATLCGLGATGVLLEITLRVCEAFRLREVQASFAFDEVVDGLDRVVSSAEYVRLWWWPQARECRVSAMDRTDEPKRPVGSWLWHSLVGYHVVQFLLFLGLFAPSFNLWIGRFTAWLVRPKTVSVDDSLNIFNLDCKYKQHTTEWAVPYDRAQECLRALRDWFEDEFADPKGLRPHCALEVRVSDADEVWLSPSYGQRTCWIGIIQYKPYNFNVPYRALFARFEDILRAHGGRPHWAKAHNLLPSALSALYPKLEDFRRLLREVDPEGVFGNEYVGRHVWGRGEEEGCGERVFKARK